MLQIEKFNQGFHVEYIITYHIIVINSPSRMCSQNDVPFQKNLISFLTKKKVAVAFVRIPLDTLTSPHLNEKKVLLNDRAIELPAQKKKKKKKEKLLGVAILVQR